MSNLGRTNLQTLYGTSGSTFPDNTTGEISESDMRTFGQDLTDSHVNKTDDVYTAIFPSAAAADTDTYTATLSPAITAYTSGMGVRVVFANPNTGAATINLNGLGAKAITKNGATALAAGDISAGQALLLYYDGIQFQIQGGGGGAGSADGITFTPAGTISATDVQAAIEELDNETQAALAVNGIGNLLYMYNNFV